MAWQQLTLRLPAEAFPRAEAFLRLAGAASISISDDGDSPILEPPPASVPLWPQLKIRAIFDEALDIGAISQLIGSVADSEITLERLDDSIVAARAPEPIGPQEIGPRLTIVAADELESTGSAALGIHMGLAFGTGRHPTTRLCLEWLERELPPGARVLDYGAGSGILALAALKLGADQATAVDIEPQALAATASNARLNGLDSSIVIGPPEIPADERFDVIIANILARPLLELHETFAQWQAEGGVIVLSGVLASQLDELESAYRKSYRSISRCERAGWGLLTGRRRNGYDP